MDEVSAVDSVVAMVSVAVVDVVVLDVDKEDEPGGAGDGC